MMLKNQRRSNSATVLIAVLSILAVLSLLAATFGMVMLVELGASKNQTEHEMAREAANAGYQYLMRVIKDDTTGALANGVMPDGFCPDPSNGFFCQELYAQKGVKVGFVLHESDDDNHEIGSTSWPRGVGMTNSGMFNINCMGSAADMGDPAYVGGNRYTSYEASLVRLLASRFASDIVVGDIEAYFGPGSWTAAEQLRVARYIASAIVHRRYGADGLPGTRGLETHRHDHLPAWFRETPYWAAYDAANDNGAAASGVFWGKVLAVTAAPGPYTITVDNTGPGWIDWPANRWNNWYVYIPATREWTQITLTTNPNQIVINPPTAPIVGDEFCIVPTGNSSACDIGEGDLAPTALLWPNGVLATENYIQPLVLRKGTLLEDAFLTTQLTLDEDVGLSWLGCIIRIMEGPLRGQARHITPNLIDPEIVAISPELPSSPLAELIDDASGSVVALGTPTTLDVAGNPWGIDEHKGKVIEFTDNSAGPTVESRVILNNTSNQIIIDGADPFSASPDLGDTYRIRHLGYQIERDYLDAGQADDTATTANTLRNDAGAVWTPDQWIGCVVNIWMSGDPDEVGQTRLILSNTVDTLILARNWNDLPNTASVMFRIELPQDAKYRPDDLQGDDLAYRSVPEIIPVMVDAVWHDPSAPAADLNEAGVIAAMLYNAVKNDLTVSSGVKKEEGAGINDWLLDGIDNDDNGVVDDEDLDLSVPADLEMLATNLYNNLGLRDWAHVSDTANRVAQSAQIIANIIDFRDDDHVPTKLTYSDIGEVVTYDFGDVYGAEGLHITEVMTTPAAVGVTVNDIDDLSAGAVGDGGTSGGDDPLAPVGGDVDDDDIDWDDINLVQGDEDGWDWDAIAGCWVVYDPVNVTGSWTFAGLRDGWYAIRIHGGSATDNMALTQGAISGLVTTDFDYDDDPIAEEWWGYVRDGVTSKLIAVQVIGGVLSFDLTADQGVEFYGFQLLPQYIEITNIAANDIQLGAHELDVVTIDGSTETLAIPSEAVIRGASADGVFPINYGTYVIAMSEEAYDRQWGATTDGSWNDANEDYPVWFAGDDVLLGDEFADKLLLLSSDSGAPPAGPSVTLKDVVNGVDIIVAGDVIDGIDGSTIPSTDAVSLEKTTLLGTTWGDYASAPFTAAELMGSQNRVADSAATPVYTNLNRSFLDLWVSVPTFDYTDIRPATGGADPIFDPAGMIGVKEVLPIILNRPYASPGCLGLVPLGNIDGLEWRTIDFNPDLHNPPAAVNPPDAPEELLGTLMTRALVGGVHARINLNNPSEEMRLHSLKTIFDDATATTLSQDFALGWRPVGGWANWDQMLNTDNMQNIVQTTAVDVWSDSVEDSGAGTYADDFVDDSDEREEWARQYSNLIDLQTSNFKYIIAGLAFDAMAKDNANPVAEVRIEIELDISDITNPQVVNYRYLTE